MQVMTVCAEKSILGESPLWDARSQTLYWVDIVKPALHSLNPVTNEHKFWPMPSAIGSIGLHAKGGLIAAMQTGFAYIELPSGNIQMLDEPIKNRSDVMFNDGKCDGQGRFWAGTKDILETTAIGNLYCLHANGISEEMDQGFIVSNGIAWSPDNTIMYACDSPSRLIYQYDFNPASGAIANKRIFVRVPDDAGYPDGLTIDSEGFIWSAHWDGWRISRYNPNGKIDAVIKMPVQRPTSCCFGGKNLQTLYITSAYDRLTSTELSQSPQSGMLFAIETETTGLPEPAYGVGQ